jgi:2-dehydro-3-deoxyphosphogluconate aldolase/(4S)-4-hydroxy-2-oxoglutarate aldolase
MDLDRFRRLPLLGIARGIALADVEPLAEVVIDAGLSCLEIAMNTPAAPALIARMRAVAGERLMVGAGTVLDLDALGAARAAGASFIVLPTLVPAVVERCAADRVPVFPGALTPQEIHAAWTAGATMVKVFPAGVFGPTYLRDIKGPFADLELLAVGGVDAANMAAYFSCGASAVAFGASVFRREWLAARAYDRIAGEVRRLVAACAAAVRTT